MGGGGGLTGTKIHKGRSQIRGKSQTRRKGGDEGKERNLFEGLGRGKGVTLRELVN